MKCPGINCESEKFSHIHNCAHGIPGTHMEGSERFICKECEKVIYITEGKELGFNYILDKE